MFLMKNACYKLIELFFSLIMSSTGWIHLLSRHQCMHYTMAFQDSQVGECMFESTFLSFHFSIITFKSLFSFFFVIYWHKLSFYLWCDCVPLDKQWLNDYDALICCYTNFFSWDLSTRARCRIFSKLTINTLERCH